MKYQIQRWAPRSVKRPYKKVLEDFDTIGEAHEVAKKLASGQKESDYPRRVYRIVRRPKEGAEEHVVLVV